jgi:hypothetical protein
MACGEDINPVQMDLTATEGDQAVAMDLTTVAQDLTLPPNADLTGVISPDLATAASPDLATVASPDMTPARKRVFITAGSWNGDLKTAGGGSDGLDGANKLCQTAATNATLGGTWVAWLSDSTHDAKDRIADVGPWYRIDGMMVFANKAALTGHPMVAISVTETGGTPTGSAQFPFTGTLDGGTKDTNLCGDWTVTTGNGRCGVYNATNNNWTQGSALSCGVSYSLYCFEQ